MRILSFPTRMEKHLWRPHARRCARQNHHVEPGSNSPAARRFGNRRNKPGRPSDKEWEDRVSRRGRRPSGCTWPDDTGLAGRQARWPPRLARSPSRLPDVAGKRKRPRPSRLGSDIHGIQTGQGPFSRLAARALPETGYRHDQLPISAPGLLGPGNSQLGKSLVAGRIAFIHRQAGPCRRRPAPGPRS